MVPFLLTFSLIIVTLNLLMLASYATSSSNDSTHYMSYDCATSDNSYVAGSPFEANLNDTLLNILPANASLASFSKFTIGQGIDQLYALAYCRGDIKGQDCRDCLEAAARTILQQCHLLKEGIIWYDECTLRYANRTIFATEEVIPYYLYYNFSSVLNNLNQQEQSFQSLMVGLIQKAAYDEKQQGFATGQTALPPSQMILRGLMQCSPDIIGLPCDKCLRSAVKQRDGWSNTMVFFPSCSFRFVLYPSQMTLPATSGGHRRSIPLKIIVPVMLVIVLLLCGAVFLLIRARKRKLGNFSGGRSRGHSGGEQGKVGNPEVNRQWQQQQQHPDDKGADATTSMAIIAENLASVVPTSDSCDMCSSPSHSAAHCPYLHNQDLASNLEPSAPPFPEGMAIDRYDHEGLVHSALAKSYVN